MKIYLAARYSRHAEMRRVRDWLAVLGHQVTSTWIDQHGGALPDSLTTEALNTEPDRCGRFADVDVEDLAAADTVISFTSPGGGGKGGRHVEFGVALGLGKRCLIVGPRENIFHTLPTVEQVPDWSALIAKLSIGWSVDCLACDLTGEPLSHLDEADQLAAVHDDLHHRGVPTATPVPSDLP